MTPKQLSAMSTEDLEKLVKSASKALDKKKKSVSKEDTTAFLNSPEFTELKNKFHSLKQEFKELPKELVYSFMVNIPVEVKVKCDTSNGDLANMLEYDSLHPDECLYPIFDVKVGDIQDLLIPFSKSDLRYFKDNVGYAFEDLEFDWKDVPELSERVNAFFENAKAVQAGVQKLQKLGLAINILNK